MHARSGRSPKHLTSQKKLDIEACQVFARDSSYRSPTSDLQQLNFLAPVRCPRFATCNSAVRSALGRPVYPDAAIDL